MDAIVSSDAAPDAAPEDAGTDAGPIETTGQICEPCRGDSDCQPDHYCANLSVGGEVCLPRCNIDLPDCPARFECVMNFTDTIPEPVCAPVGERCCVDEDEDLHGSGVGCLGIDCDDADDATHASATEACDGADNNCNGTIDDGDPATMCPRGTHVATTACTSGACAIVDCEPGFADCDLDAANGCETATNTETSCGGCGIACDPANATGDCASGACRVGTCDAGFGDCDMDPTNGCETSLLTASDCGGCGRTCSPAGAIGECATGTCGIAACDPNRGDCDGRPENGCETLLTTNSDCGMCRVPCAPAGGIGDCSTGTCRLTACTTPGTADCDGLSSNGCETSTRTLSDCGGCGVPCSHMGASSSCASGTCALAGCLPGFGNCDGVDGNGCEQSLDTMTHCGGCGNACTIANGTGECTTGSCRVASCNPGWGNCDGNHANGCEQPLNTTTHCGGCGVGCSLAHAGESCSSGACLITTCDSLWGNCDSSHSSGCERSLTTTSNCGGCGVGCSRPNGTVSCSTGSCTLTGCNSGYSNCDSNATNGCELGHGTTVGSCGAGTSAGTYDGDRSCGFICGGNTGWDTFYTGTGTRDAWFRARVREDSDCSTDIEHRVRLTVPAGIDYDLRVYRGSGCGTLVGTSTVRGTTGHSETVTVREGESTGSDDSFDYYVHVDYVSGATCSPFTIYFDGHDC